ncbi:MAG: DMT family transporter [Candidatus Liptonbacteria bacterium]|nr:DMT family transporter [Candidatus Liptonbacteria bacterium]
MWIIFALGASIVWGITYVLGEQIYKKISVITALSITTLLSGVVMFIVAYAAGFLKKDISTVFASKGLLALVLSEAACLMIAELFIGFSITGKNATLAGLIEISYPLFIALFAYLLFRENQINLATMVGGIVIFTGVFIIYYFNS